MEHTNFEQIIAVSHYPVTQDYLISERNANIIEFK